MYPLMILGLFLVLPVASIAVEAVVRRRRGRPVDLLAIAFRWFVFWPVGVRLFTAGIAQIANPSYTARDIFGVDDPVILPIISELGFANVAIGSIALASVAVARWRVPAAVAGAVYFGLAGLRHVIAGGEFTDQRLIAMVSDLFIAAVLVACLAALAVRVARRPRTAAAD